MSQLSVTNLTKIKTPLSSVFLEKIKREILGPNYDLSLVFCDEIFSRQLNLRYRQKDKIANVLSFPLSKTSGEIFINLPAGKQNSQVDRFSVPHLFIHGLLHLKGLAHGSKMNNEERRFLALFKISDGQPTPYRRIRYRHRVDAVDC